MLLVKVFICKKACDVVLQSSKHEEITFPHGFAFVFISCFIGVILSKNVIKSGGFGKG